MSDPHYHSQDMAFGQGLTPAEAAAAGRRDAAIGGGNAPTKPPGCSNETWAAFQEGRSGN